jgi:hypothetical protein
MNVYTYSYHLFNREDTGETNITIILDAVFSII